VKLVEHSGTKKEGESEKSGDLETNRKNKNILEIYVEA
jgi:hypothetical protein